MSLEASAQIPSDRKDCLIRATRRGTVWFTIRGDECAHELNMAALECIVCQVIIQKKGDVNLVHGKREIDAGFEIGNLSFVVQPLSLHICRSCLNLIKQRSNLKKKLEEAGNKLLVGYQEKARIKGFAVKMKESAKRSLRFNEDLSCNTLGPSHFTPNDNLTPACARTAKSIPSSTFTFPISLIPIAVVPAQPLASSTPVSQPLPSADVPAMPVAQPLPIPPGNAPAVPATNVTVEVRWESGTKRRILPADLCSLGKMLCRGTYTQIARAAWRNEKLREQLVLLFLKEIDNECTGMCSLRRPSLLRKTAKEDILKFSLTAYEEELKARMPLFRSVLLAASVRKNKKKNSDPFWMPAVCMASAICLKNRSAYMTAMQLLNTIFIQHSGLMVSSYEY
jgi:hypothetical protein